MPKESNELNAKLIVKKVLKYVYKVRVSFDKMFKEEEKLKQKCFNKLA